jgi:hypothetical protein
MPWTSALERMQRRRGSTAALVTPRGWHGRARGEDASPSTAEQDEAGHHDGEG